MDKGRCFISRDGIPKICVPVLGRNRSDVLDEVRLITGSAADFVEWRLDCYDDVDNVSDVLETAGMIRDILGSMPLLATFRTLNEGGQREISFDGYQKMLLAAAINGAADMIDVEMFFGETPDAGSEKDGKAFSCSGRIRELVSELKQYVTVIGSYHDFNKTPGLKEMFGILCAAAEGGADIPKLAVMPNSEEDVLFLMQATLQAKRQLEVPVITMSMGKTGAVSRLIGESFGSSVTFGCMGKESAPGQINADALRRMLEDIHKCRI